MNLGLAIRMSLTFSAFAMPLTSPVLADPLAKLPALGAQKSTTTVSGLSSGAFMAVQYGVAFSADTPGVGVVAGGPYGCGVAGAMAALSCMKGMALGGGGYFLSVLYQANGLIDPIGGIAAQRIYMFHGTKDAVVAKGTMDALQIFYQDLDVPAANLIYSNDIAAGHAFVSDDLGNPCSTNADPYIVQCNVDGGLYDQPGAILSQVLGQTLSPKASALSSSPQPFTQEPYLTGMTGMAKTGYLYAPESCKADGASCRVHVVFHGCGQAAAYVGDDVYGQLGYNEWADSNGVIMLYPQVEKSELAPVNPMGCWDWWGYTGPLYATRQASQMRAVRAMLDALYAPA